MYWVIGYCVFSVAASVWAFRLLQPHDPVDDDDGWLVWLFLLFSPLLWEVLAGVVIYYYWPTKWPNYIMKARDVLNRTGYWLAGGKPERGADLP